MKVRVLEEIDFTLEVPAVNYKKTITLVVKQKSIVQELHDDIIAKLKPSKYRGNEKKYVEGALKHIDFLVDENVIFIKDENSSTSSGFYDGKLNVTHSDSTEIDDIKITIFHEYLHYVNYMEKIFPYRYSDESSREIYFEMDDCYIFREATFEEIYDDYLITMQIQDEDWIKNSIEELDDDKKKIILKYKEDNIIDYSKKKCIYGQYKPSNYFRDEYYIYTICLKEEGNLLKASEIKLKNYKEMKNSYEKAIKTSSDYEKKKNYDSTGFEK